MQSGIVAHTERSEGERTGNQTMNHALYLLCKMQVQDWWFSNAFGWPADTLTNPVTLHALIQKEWLAVSD